jgi:pimeloyl-ACP methyl ester carboxylesterase
METKELLLAANGLDFRCLAAGPEDGRLVLLLHGFPEGAESWTAQLAALSDAGWLAVAPDLRGYGGSSCPEGVEAYRMPHLIADVEGLMEGLGHERCHLAGHDWGSLLGWSVVSHRPERVITWSALSVGHPQAFADTIAQDEDQRRRSSYITLFLQTGHAEEVLAAENHRRLREFYRIGPGAVPDDQIEKFVKAMARPGRLTAGLNYYRANLGRPAQQEFPPAPNPIATPTQLVWGDQDPALGPGPAHLTERYVAGEYRLEVLQGAGHWLQFERPDDVNRLLLEWVTRVPSVREAP